MADQGKSEIEVFRQYYATSGREYKAGKRKLSGDKVQSSEKRDKKSSQETDTSARLSNTADLDLPEVMPIDTGEVLKAMKQVMMDDDFSEMLTRKFKRMCDDRIDEKTGEIKEELQEVREEQNRQREEQDKQKASIENVINKIDNFEQDKCLNNRLLRGIKPEGGNLKQACIATLNKEMKIHLKTTDLAYVIPIGKSEDQLMKVAFNDGKTREKV